VTPDQPLTCVQCGERYLRQEARDLLDRDTVCAEQGEEPFRHHVRRALLRPTEQLPKQPVDTHRDRTDRQAQVNEIVAHCGVLHA